MTKKQWIAVGVIVALIALPVGLKLARSDTNKAVDVEAATTHALTPTVLASGSLTYESQVTLTPEVTGRVKEILVAEGDQVKRDQLLMRLDPNAPLAAIEQSKAQVRQARLSIERRQVDFDAQVIKVRRFEALQAKGMVDSNSLEELISARNLAEVDLRTSREHSSQAQAQLSQAEENSPRPRSARHSRQGDGYHVKVGQTAVPSFSGIAGSILVDVADTTSIDAEINVDETDIARVRVGAAGARGARGFSRQGPERHGGPGRRSRRARWGPRTRATRFASASRTRPDVIFHPGMSCRAEVLTTRQGRCESARGSGTGTALRGQSGQIFQCGKIGCQRLRPRRGPGGQARRHHRHRR